MSIIIVAKWKVLTFAHLCHEAANLGHFLFFFFLSVDKLCQDSNVSGHTVIQEVRTWIEPQAYWFMAPLRLGRGFQAT